MAPDLNPFHDPTFCALLSVLVCLIALVAWKVIDEWDAMRAQAKREKHIRKNRWWDRPHFPPW